MTKARIVLDKKILEEQKSIMREYYAKTTVDMSYSVVKNLYHENYVRGPICAQLDKKLTDPLAYSRAFRIVHFLEEPWELIGNANDAGATSLNIFVHAFGNTAVSAFIDDGKGFDHFFALNPALTQAKKASKTGFVAFDRIKDLRYLLDKDGTKNKYQFNNRKFFEKKEKGLTCITGARGKGTECLSEFLGPGNVLMGNVSDLRKSPYFQKMIGLTDEEVALLPKTGAVMIMCSPLFSKEVYLSFLNTNPLIIKGTLEARYKDYVLLRYPELNLDSAPPSPELDPDSPSSAKACMGQLTLDFEVPQADICFDAKVHPASAQPRIIVTKKKPPAIQTAGPMGAIQSASIVTTHAPSTCSVTGDSWSRLSRFSTFSSFSPLPAPIRRGLSEPLSTGKMDPLEKDDTGPQKSPLTPKTS